MAEQKYCYLPGDTQREVYHKATDDGEPVCKQQMSDDIAVTKHPPDSRQMCSNCRDERGGPGKINTCPICNRQMQPEKPKLRDRVILTDTKESTGARTDKQLCTDCWKAILNMMS
jgi:hypothetical protein